MSEEEGVKDDDEINYVMYVRENQQIHQLLLNLLVTYGLSYMFRHFIAILRQRY
jgi:hypothetical protein